MTSVLAKMYLTRGWRPLAPEDAKVTALVWIEVMDRHRIGYRRYEELYQRAMDLRIKQINEGVNVSDLTAELLAAQWPQLEREIREREVEAGRTLTGFAGSVCPKCHGTGIPYKFDAATGERLGVMAGKVCDHQPEPGCPLFPTEQTEEAITKHFETIHDKVRSIAERQMLEEFEASSDGVITKMADAVWEEAEAMPSDSEEQRAHGEIWLKVLSARRYIWEMDGRRKRVI